MDIKTIKLLAQNTLENEKVNERVAEFALTKLTASELKKYLFYVKQTLKKNTVYVTITDDIDIEVSKKIEKMFEGKKVEYIINKNIGAGVIIQDNDDNIDASIKGMIHNVVRTIEKDL